MKDKKNSPKCPNLRFPEFEGEWEEKLLGEIATKSNTKNKNDKYTIVFSNSAKYGLVFQDDFFDRSIVNSNNLNGYYIVKPNNFVYNPRLSTSGPVGAMNVNHTGHTGLVSPLYTVFTISRDSVSIPFLEYFFSSMHWHKYMKEIANFGARDDRMNIKNDDFFKLPIFMPLLTEQKKIASLLSKIDQRINTQIKIIEELERLKKGLCQQMIDTTIRPQPQLRINTFFGDWNIVKSDMLFERISDKKHPKGAPILAVTQDNGVAIRDEIDYKITVSTQSVESYKVIQKDDYVISLRSFQGGIEYSGLTGICSPAYTILRAKRAINYDFYRFYFKLPNYINQLNRRIEGIRDGRNISYDNFSSVPIPFPSLKEQEAIVTVLKSIEDKVALANNLLAEYNKQKTYILQNLFI